MLPSTPGSSKWSPSLRFPHQKPVCTSPLPHTCHMPSPSHSSPLRQRHNHNIITEFPTSPLPYPVRYHTGTVHCRTLYVTMLGQHIAVHCTLPCWDSTLPYLYVTILGQHTAVRTLPYWDSTLPYPVGYYAGTAHCRTLYVTMLGQHTAVPCTLPYWDSTLPYPVRYHAGTAHCRTLYVTMLGQQTF